MTQIILNTNWEFKEQQSSDWLPASVPGCVHTDLQATGAIDDPFYGTNENRCQWIEYKNWLYRTNFEISDATLKEENIDLIFEGLDTYTTIFVNGQQLSQTDNMFRTWRFSIKELLKPGQNDLEILFESPTNKVLPDMAKMGYRYHAVQDNAIEASALTRKAPYHYGWDWGPRFVTSGIWRPVSIQARSTARMESVFIQQKSLDSALAKLILETELVSEEATDVTVRLTHLKKSEILLEAPATIIAGTTTNQFEFEIANPELWYPNGYGEPHLYTLQVDVLINGKVIDTKTIKIGLRTLELRRNADQWGESFEFVVNGIPVFIKGANWIPADSFITNIEPERYEALIVSSKKVHFNMLRVWGGGIYEEDIFYDLCDKHGILVWQDFMFACSLFPADDAFLESVKQEGIDNIKRIRNHPSLVLWCGNNENEWIYDFEGDGMKNRFGESDAQINSFKEDYEKLNNQLLKSLVTDYNPNLSYWPSSPSSDYKAEANDDNYGDIHHWDVWHMGYPIENYKKLSPRFISEFGFQSMPNQSTVDTYLEEEQRFIGSPAMATHQKHARGYDLIKTYLERSYPASKDFEGFCYLTQIQQADYMKFAIEHFRSLAPKCMGILYWQLNDCWPVCSWSSIDYDLKWKVFHYYLRDAYAPILVYPQLEKDRIEIKLVSDINDISKVELRWSILDFEGGTLLSESLEVEKVPRNKTKSIVTVPLSKIKQQMQKNNNYMLVEVLKDGTSIAQNRLFFDSYKNLNYNRPAIEVKVKDSGSSVICTVISKTFVKGVRLEFTGDDGFFERNYFDLDPNREIEINYFPEDKEKIHLEKLKIYSFYQAIS